MSDRDTSAVKKGLIENPKKFLSKNILLVPSPTANLNCSYLRKFDFDLYEGPKTTTYSGNIDRGNLLAYYLPWGENSGYHVVLENNDTADIMFTAQLSGCAVGYIRASDGSGAVRVSHHNIQTANGSTDDAAMKESLDFAQSTLHRGDYRTTPDMYAYYYGIRQKGMISGVSWKFYRQIVKQVGLGEFTVESVAEV
ncbi:hypothetical protein [Marinibactrum halimedae]|uniref:Uncharacterized protein n=1 Tax=Marinibactrum halimedae TaxID=1444977 RepID=A0AA37T2H4_9GAMM|nr:hypothetical protein [Marinibactrum halimedae]MCD9457688.1 hypothetical protein [Marinibactrum halimedae]GLS24939.1 hypothetical protein GCM10007877_06530 [Marinibactrum halimedae]